MSVPNVKVNGKFTKKDERNYYICAKLALSMIYINVEHNFKKITENSKNLIDAWKKIHKPFLLTIEVAICSCSPRFMKVRLLRMQVST